VNIGGRFSFLHASAPLLTRIYFGSFTLVQALAIEVDEVTDKAITGWLEQHDTSTEAPENREWIEATRKRMSTWFADSSKDHAAPKERPCDCSNLL
jgi:hypothetical protein